MTQKEEYLKEQAEIVCNSIAFWEKKIIEASELDSPPEEEVSYLFMHLNFDMSVMEELDKECQTLQKKRDGEHGHDV